MTVFLLHHRGDVEFSLGFIKYDLAHAWLCSMGAKNKAAFYHAAWVQNAQMCLLSFRHQNGRE